jgi:hypothetical protein
MDVTAESVIAVHEIAGRVQGLRFSYEPTRLRFFQARFECLHPSGIFGGVSAPERALAMASSDYCMLP